MNEEWKRAATIITKVSLIDARLQKLTVVMDFNLDGHSLARKPL